MAIRTMAQTQKKRQRSSPADEARLPQTQQCVSLCDVMVLKELVACTTFILAARDSIGHVFFRFL